MKLAPLPLALLTLLLMAAGCGENSASPTPNKGSICVPSSKPSFAYVLNSNNTVLSYSVDSCTGALTPTAPSTVATNGNDFGSESRAVDPAGRFAYVANLMSNAADLATISMFTINPNTGVLTPTTPATVPTGYFPQGIGIDPMGRFVYTANSDDNTISMFTID
jgi:6-phosphogluconolactonase